MKKIKLSVVCLLLILLAIVFTACSNTTGKDEQNLIRLGINGDESEVWAYIKEELAKEGINLEIVSFSDYTRPNLALSEGEIDINSFQHYASLTICRGT